MRYIWFVTLTVALAVPAWAEESSSTGLTLAESYRLALAHDARLAAAEAARTAGREKLAQGRALLLPSLSLAADTAYNDLDVTFQQPSPLLQSGTRRYNSHQYGVVLRQPLYRKTNFAQYRQSQAFAAQADTGFAVARQDLILRTVQAYFDVLLAEDTLRYLEAQQAAIGALRDRMQRAFDAGTAAITDVREAAARADLVRAQEIGARNELEFRREALAMLTGEPPRVLVPLRAPLAFAPPQPPDPQHWMDAAEQSGLAVALAHENEEIARQEWEARRGAHFPTLDLAASYGDARQNNSLFGIGYDTTGGSIGVQVQMPLYAGGALSAQVREAAARHEQARQELVEARRQARLDARDAYLRLASGLAQVPAFEQAVLSSETSLAATTRGLETGTRTALDVLNAQQQHYGARRDLVQARHAVILTGLRLKAAVGRLSGEDLAEVNRLLDIQPQP